MADEINKPDATPNPAGAAPETQAATGDAAPGAQPDQPADPIQSLEDQITKLDAEKADLTDRLLRAHAELENIRKRAEREKEETARYAISKFARDIVAVSDNFERAIQSVPSETAEQDGPLKSLVEGVSMTERELLNVLERHGIKRVSPKGEIFNPHLHQAMMEIQNAELPAGTITEVFQPGYVIEDRVLRPAMVIVAKGGEKPGKTAADQSTQSAATAPQPDPIKPDEPAAEVPDSTNGEPAAPENNGA